MKHKMNKRRQDALRLLDTSVILRFLTRDDPQKAARARRLLLESDEDLLITDGVFIELVFGLEKLYGWSKAEISAALGKLLSSRRIDFTNREVMLQALVLYREHSAPFVDAYQVALGRSIGAEGIYTYDSDFERKLKFPALEP
jgi:predicted nucleic-acid-binding protein